MKILDRLPHTPWIPIILGILMTLPTLRTGLIMDDVLVKAKLSEVASPWTPAEWWDLYTFAREDINGKLLEAGHHPWWAHPEVKMTFFRPVSALTHILDYQLWPEQTWLHHLHSILWYGLAIFMVFWVLSGIFPNAKKAVMMAAIAFAVATPHAMTVGWLAGRNTVISFVAALLFFELYRRWRESGKIGLLWSSLGVFVVGLLTGEAALGGIAYMLSWEMFMMKKPLKNRVLALMPHFMIFLGWYIGYALAGFGAANTGIYHDPATDLPDFVLKVVTHFPVLFMGKWALIPLDFWAIIPLGPRYLLTGIGLLFMVGVGAMMWPLLKKHALSRFFAVGMLISFLPFTATLPMDRLVLFAGLGAAALLGQMATQLPEKNFLRVVWKVMLFIHLPVATLLGVFRSATLDTVFSANTSGYTQAPIDEEVPEQTFVYVTTNFHRVHYTTLMRTLDGNMLGVPKRSVILSSTTTANTITRTGSHTLEIVPEGGFMNLLLEQIHRRSSSQFTVGDRVSLPDLEVEILELNAEGNPARAAFHFNRPLEDPSLRWLVVEPEPGSTFPPVLSTHAFELPAIGETVYVQSAL